MKAITVSPLMPKYYPIASNIAKLSGLQWSQERLMVEAGKPRKEAIAAFCGNTLVGWLLYRKGKRDFEILAVVVRPEMRRQGIASAMVGRLQDWAANYDLLDVITARVLEGDLANQLFFRKLGFRVKDAAHDDEEYKFRWEVKEYERG